MSLQKAIRGLLENGFDQNQVEYFVDLCQKIALTYLEQKATTGRIDPRRLAASLDDFALDSIAGLFERDHQNQFVKLKKYFESILSSLTDEHAAEMHLLTATRKLVFKSVNDSLYLHYRKLDANLARSIRNLKDAIDTWNRAPALTIERRRGQPMVLIHTRERCHSHMESASPENLEAHLVPLIKSNASDRQLLEWCIEILIDVFSVYSYPLTWLAQATCRARLRAVSTTRYEIHGETAKVNQTVGVADAEIGELDLEYERIEKKIDYEWLIQHSVNTVYARMHHSYVGRQKMDTLIYNALFRAISGTLTAQYVHGLQLALLPALQASLPNLTPQEYAANYRTILEYLHRLTREAFHLHAKEFLEA